MIEITLLGTAALFPTPERALTAAVLSCNGRSILFDCGEGTQSAARKAGVSLMKTDVIALTHYHGDHTLGLPGLLQTLHNLERKETLYIVGPAGLQEEMEPVFKLARRTAYPVELLEISADGLKLSELHANWSTAAKLTAFKTEHRVPSQGYCFTLERAGKFLPDKATELGVPVNQWGILQKGQRIRLGDNVILPEQVLGSPRKGLKFLFTGDTMACENLVVAAEDADLMICEATYGENEQAQQAAEYGHMTFAQAAEIARKARVKQLWLAHYSQMIKNPQAYLPNATAIFENTLCGKDSMSKTLRFDS